MVNARLPMRRTLIVKYPLRVPASSTQRIVAYIVGVETVLV
jgi:hypothetical protein